MAYIEWWNRTGPITMGERFGLNEISTRAKTLSPIKSYTDGGRIGYNTAGKVDGIEKFFTLKKEKIPGTKSSKVVDVVANTPEAKTILDNFIEEYRLSKEYAKTSTAADQAGVKRTRALYDKYFKNHYTWNTYNQNILSAIKKKYNIPDNPIISDDPEKLKRYNAAVDEKIARKLQKRYEQDPFKLKQKARKIAGMTGDARVAFHHALGLDSPETLNSLIVDKDFEGSKGVTGNSTVEKAVRDFEKQLDNLKLKKPEGWERKSEELLAKLNRLKNGKEVNYQYTTSKGTTINTKVKFTPKQLGLYGFQADTSTGYKGLDTSQTVGSQTKVSAELGNKPLNQLNKVEQKQAINSLVKALDVKKNQNISLPKSETIASKALGLTKQGGTKVLSGVDKVLRPLFVPAVDLAIHRDATSPTFWMTKAFWANAMDKYGITRTYSMLKDTPDFKGKSKILRDIALRGIVFNPKAVRFISSKVAWPATAAASVYDAYKDYQKRKPDIEKVKELRKQGVIKEEEFDKEEPMFAMGGIASLIK